MDKKQRLQESRPFIMIFGTVVPCVSESGKEILPTLMESREVS